MLLSTFKLDFKKESSTSLKQKWTKYKSYSIPLNGEATSLGTGGKKMYFYTFFPKDCVVCVLETLQNKRVLSKIQHIILILFYYRIHAMLYKLQKLFSKYDVWQQHLMLLKYMQTFLVIKEKSQRPMHPSTHLLIKDRKRERERLISPSLTNSNALTFEYDTIAF